MYWQYKGEPALLIGGTCNDNLFQDEGLKAHLDSLRKAGGNYVRTTMSDRDRGDRFDHSQVPWLGDPFNPGNNVNYSYREAGLDSVYPEHPGRNVQPFFFTVPALDNNEMLLHYQKSFVDKLLSISLSYGNVLYCIDNETSGSEEWAIFWTDYIQNKAGEKEIYITEMWDDWDVKSGTHKRTLDHPERYGFVDISQNSHRVGPPGG
jgi:hypothetical protein